MAAGTEFHVVGDALVDVLANGIPAIPSWGGDVYASGIHIKPGGCGLNTAVHLASVVAQETSVTFHGCVGHDTSAKIISARLEEAGVRPCLVALEDHPTGSCVVLSGSDDRSFITCMGAAGAIAAEHLKGIMEALRSAQKSRFHIHFAGFYSYGPLRFELPDFIVSLRQEAARLNVPKLTVSVDMNGYEDCQIEGMMPAIEHLDLWKGNEIEAKSLCGSETADEAMKLLSADGRSCVITKGRDGASFCGPSEAGHVSSKTVDVVDTTGAGDACSAALLASWVSGESLQTAVTRGCAAGSLNCTAIGGCDTPVTSDAVTALLKS
eukprot:TRINITY_DN22754_c0_g1_i1.p1 TRINITY_DN22754_c0_g1~~TRINITY_DN22754_c0_g1_i1.p1  ORF type:complete len:323 (-),score=50.21 TRINITY_DN22754_c0_g1_i1:35-1003(-)